MELTYRLHRGYHHWLCLSCGRKFRERIPDQASEEYEHNPANPILAVCAWCNGTATASLRLGHSSIPAPPNLPMETQRPAFDGVWGEFWEIARQFERKAKYQDREDLRHEIILRLFDVALSKVAKGEEFSEVAKRRTASLVVMEHWHSEKRNGKVISLNIEVEDWELDPTELIDTIGDDSAIDIEAWVDAKTWLMGCPKRLVGIAHKRVSGIPLTKVDQKYLERYRRSQQLALPV